MQTQSIKNNCEGFCVIIRSPNTAQNRVRCLRWLLFFGKENDPLVLEASPVQIPPTFPFPSPLLFLFSLFETVFFPGSERKCSCVESCRLNEKNQPIWLTFLAKAIIFCCQGITFTPEQFLGSSRLCITAQCGLSCCHITHRTPLANQLILLWGFETSVYTY